MVITRVGYVNDCLPKPGIYLLGQLPRAVPDPEPSGRVFYARKRQPAFLRDRSRLCGHRIGSYKGRRAIAADQSD